MQAIINGEMYEVEPAVKAYIDELMIENADLKRENNRLERNNLDLQAEFCKQGAKIDELKKENARLEEGYQKSTRVIAATEKLVDANALANYANNQIVGITANDIMRFPTVDAEPVKHGRWESCCNLMGEYFKCSECGYKAEVPTCMGEPIFIYCPNCGAEMDGGAENETD